MSANPFQKATKTQLKARVGLAGPTGSGKTYTSLGWAQVLAEGGPIAVVDTEHGSASLYSDRFDFDVLTWEPPYNPTALADTVRAAQSNGYRVLVIDSLSHFWEGEGGTLDIADAAGQRSGGNSFAGWKVATPALRHLVDTLLACDMHVIVTMRSKMEYVLEENERGKKVPRKVGMAPVMRQGVEYEFTIVGELDHEHRLTITKSRYTGLADQVIQPGRAADAAAEFLAWLSSGDPDPVAVRRNAFDLLPAEKQEAILEWVEKGTGVRSVDLAPRVIWERLDALIERAQQSLNTVEGGDPSPEGSVGTGRETTEVSSGERDAVTVGSPEGTQPPGAPSAAAREALDKAAKR